ncbi:MAG: hypothetical protein ACJ8F7_20170, partial [Gemmataceae bacterium]
AHKAQRLHGPYSMWDMGDRPEKILAEVDAAKLRSRKSAIPPNPTATVNANKPAAPTTPVAPTVPTVTPTVPVVSRPEMPTLSPVVPVVAPVAMTPARQQALALMVEVRMLEKADRLVEAKAKAIAAQALHADYAPGDDLPETAIMDLDQKGVAKINSWVAKATQECGPTPSAAAFSQAQATLTIAKQFAQGMGLATFAIDEKVQWLATAASGQPSKPMMVARPAADSKAQGSEMLTKANLELRNGQCEAARKIAEEVFSGPYGLQSEAMALLRNIEVEERNQKIVAANRAYDAACNAFNTGDYNQAVAVFLQIDGSLLTSDKRSMMKDKMNQAGGLAQAPRLKGMPEMPKVETAQFKPVTPANVQVVSLPGAPVPGGELPGSVRISDQPNVPTGPGLPTLPTPGASAPAPTQQSGPGYAAQMKALQQVEFQKQRAEALKTMSEAQKRFQKGETDAAIQMLNEQLAKLKDAQLDPVELALLVRPMESRLQTFKTLKAQRDSETTLAMRKSNADRQHAEVALERDSKSKQCAELMQQFHKLYGDGKFDDAMLLALKAQELDPDSDGPRMAVEMAKIAKRVKTAENLKNAKEQLVLDGLNDTDDQGKALTNKNPIDIDVERLKVANAREREFRTLGTHARTEREKTIERQLSTPITFDFAGTPLRQVLNDLRSFTKLNVVPQLDALKDDGVSMDLPITLKVEAIPLKSALSLLLRQVKLTYVIADDVLQVTTEKAAKGRQVQKVYSVADLVIPIDDFAVPNAANLMTVLERNSNPAGRLSGMPAAGSSMNGGQATNNSLSTVPGGAASAVNQLGGGTTTGANTTFAKKTIEDVLIKLVTNTVQPQSWAEVGGSGTIDYFPIGMALVINQTPDIQEQVAELLASLRRLQDMEVSVEVRIVTVSESFFERIGLDFSMNIKTDHYTTTYEPQITSQQFKPAGYINDFSPHGFVSGITPAGNFTSDLDIPVKSTSFNRAIPPFGYPNSPGNNGGLSLGLAFLNDIQVFMFMEAAQGDNRTNVMQAPKLTLFNGQTATALISDFQFFVTDVAVVSVNGQLVFVPNNTPFPVGPTQTGGTINLAVNAVVTADRRFVRMNFGNFQMQSLASATVPLFPVTTFITPTFEGGFTGQPIPFTQFIQQPKFASVNITTTVMVPDGGTVLMGGLKTLSEGRTEAGPPVLSKIPYVNRLFKNTGYGREAQSMMIMVTPRIIINAEESERQTGQQEIGTGEQ